MAGDGFIDLQKIPDARGRVITSEVFGQARPLYSMRSICRTMPSTKLQGRMYFGTLLAGQRKVPALIPAELKSTAFTPVEFVCWKNVAHVAIPDEAEYGELDNVMAMNTMDASRALAAMENQDIIDALGGTGITGAAFPAGNVQSGSAWSGSENEPSIDIGNAVDLMDSISDGVYSPKVMCMSVGQYNRLASNPEAKKYIQTATGFGERAVADKYYGINIKVDHFLTTGEVYFIDTDAPGMIAIDGPEKARSYENAPAFFTGYVVGKFLYVKRLIDDAVVKLNYV